MERPTDPYRTLGLPRTASLVEVKRAYWRLAKEWHPDALRWRGGSDAAGSRRFLAIQAAYQEILRTRPSRDAETGGASEREQRRGWRRPPRAQSREQRATRSGDPRPGAPSDARDPHAAGEGAAPDGGRYETDEPSSRRAARLGTTSYDDAPQAQPEWHGASWYGEASGTYWTINPREYADPRKHGPEYLERMRREGGGEAGAARSEDSAADEE